MEGDQIQFSKPTVKSQRTLPPKPPLSVIMERSSEDNTRALSIDTGSRTSSRSSFKSDSEDNNNQALDIFPKKLAPSYDRISKARPRGEGEKENSTKCAQPSNENQGFDSFVSLSESQARELFDNDVKDRIEFLTSQLDLEKENEAEIGSNTLGTSVKAPNDSYGTYFMRRSSNPVKGISDESAFFSSRLDFTDCTDSPDFETSRSVNASTPLPNRSTSNRSRSYRTQESFRNMVPADGSPLEDGSIIESPKNMADGSILSLVDYFKGQPEGKRKDSMIDFVLEYCNKKTKDSQEPRRNDGALLSKAISLPKLNKQQSLRNTHLNQSAAGIYGSTTSVRSTIERKDHNHNGIKLVRRVTESTTQLNLTIQDKSTLASPTRKKCNAKSGERKSSASHSKQLPLMPTKLQSEKEVIPSSCYSNVSNQPYVTSSNGNVGTYTQNTYQQNAGTGDCTNYQYNQGQLPPPPHPQAMGYGMPLIIQVYYPQPSQPQPNNYYASNPQLAFQLPQQGPTICIPPPPVYSTQPQQAHQNETFGYQHKNN